MHPAPGPGHPECLDVLSFSVIVALRLSNQPGSCTCLARVPTSRREISHPGRSWPTPVFAWWAFRVRGGCSQANAARAALPPVAARAARSLSPRRLPTQRSPQGAGRHLGRYARCCGWSVTAGSAVKADAAANSNDRRVCVGQDPSETHPRLFTEYPQGRQKLWTTSTTRMALLLSTAIPKGRRAGLLATPSPQDAALLPVPARTAKTSSRVNELAGDRDVAMGPGRDVGVLGT
jgi:hypothetical protein